MMEITPELARRAKEAAHDYQGEPVPLEGVGGYFLTGTDRVLDENERRLARLSIDGGEYLIIIRTPGEL